MNHLWIALTLAVLMWLLMPYWLAPIQLRLDRRMVKRPRMVPYDPSHHPPRAMTPFIEQAGGSLVPLGFAIVADLWRADFSFMRVVLMRDAKTGERHGSLRCAATMAGTRRSSSSRPGSPTAAS